MRSIVIASAVLTLHAFGNPTKFEPTHRQAFVLKPDRQGMEVAMSAFALDPSGNIVAAVHDSDESKGWVMVYSPDRKLVREHALSFAPSAIAVTADNHYLAAGNGQITKLTAEGEVVQKGELLTILGLDAKKMREEAIAEWREEQREYGGMAARQTEALKAQIERIEKTEEAKQTDRDKARLKTLRAMLEKLGKEEKEEPPQRDIDRHIQRRLYIPSIAQTTSGPLITVARGRGYEAIQLDAHFSNPRKVLGNLRGCCGQMDVTAVGDKVFAAENTKFRVGIYGLDGKLEKAFGERYKEGNNGFGSCCNPMNVVPLSSGDVLTAESSIGTIKRFNSEGKLTAVIGRARIGGGCKHVSLGFDAARDRYYVQYEDLNHICVMLPNLEAAPYVAEQDKQKVEAELAMEKLAGKWTLAGSAKTKRSKGLLGTLLGGEEEDAFGTDFSTIEFRKDKSAKLGGKMMDGDDGFRRCVVTGMEKGAIVAEFEESDGYVDFVSKISVTDENTIMIGKRTFKKEQSK